MAFLKHNFLGKIRSKNEFVCQDLRLKIWFWEIFWNNFGIKNWRIPRMEPEFQKKSYAIFRPIIDLKIEGLLVHHSEELVVIVAQNWYGKDWFFDLSRPISKQYDDNKW